VIKRSRAARIRFRFKVEVRDSRRAFEAEARDVSIDGLCLSSPILLRVGDRVGTTLFVRGGPPISLSFEVRWAQPDGPSRYRIGVEFVHTPESRKALQKLMWQIESGAVQVTRDPSDR
jgi:hypothetical protein